MKTSFVAAFAAAVVGASANYNASTTWVTDVVTAFTTVCPLATVLTYNEKTYTVSESTTLTITDCPCTISKPVIVTSSVSAQTTLYPNTTSVTASAALNGPTFTSTTSTLPTAGADRAVAFSGAALAGLVGLAALAL